MNILKKTLLPGLLFILFTDSRAQQAAAVDSIRTALAEARSPQDKGYLMDILSQTLMSVNIPHGEPWKDLAFMIGLAAILVPLHHWLEKKVLHYLTSHNRLTAAGRHLKLKFFTRRDPGQQS